MKSQKKGSHQTNKIVPIVLDTGITATMKPQDIPEDKWNHHHGKTATGQKVDSLQSATIAKSLILRKNTGGPVLSVSLAEFEVAAVQILTGMGYKMQAPANLT
ncbi:MAG: hypothetical protein UW27_C0003G0037 [Parcubacteria group bacterium GW2011_GWA1_44_13]|uniref:Uncharacterized protein n=1 Tax=Candidatus Nomurabacteria bacterium GW2011_GWB1_44_12 TaxID=1618748 RepID=A0A837I7A0_9BACT|nr:MAG: hypothetical protein UW17_C0028G0005 [Candidatus Nomurabacteria bacterium GW2011_GWD1_44_10]KKT36608.1 MAG: hypothetical protein UW25_C0005G0090 [Candidatus Nomurabacteria bacterium GW2011_GWB1_44_12]KKT38289.1 MAG: hypothetical protein UW27_C0003G0037 [Parcubacteria group bacterium GW2011_GWA1_44_13]KKT59650.1 MAG: hypothetical protein UW54_C0022G0007 [Parcubacteria group bacterium GW2011_GWC1_44_26]HBB44210.1 hypothetical protein [Candidatus Yonathbacteria bacterium]